MTIVDALDDSNLFRPHFPMPAWRSWRVFLAAVFGLPLDTDGLGLYERCTGRSAPPTGPAREVWCVVGRRGGKSRVAALLAVWTAVARDWRPFLAAGEKATIAVIAADRPQARSVFRYITGLLDAVPMLRQLVVRRTASAIELQGRVVIEVATCSHRTTRGYSFAAVIADECAFWRDERSANPDVEVIAAIRPGLATLPGSLLIGISSPYSRRGVLWRAYDEHFGKDDDPTLVWQADTATMHPRLDPEIIAAAYADDPIAAAGEYGGQFRSDLEGYLAREALEAVIVRGRYELPPLPAVQYLAFTDPSGGSADSFTLAIAHQDPATERVILDAVREVKPPFNPDNVVAEFVAVLRSYRIRDVEGDRYGGAWVAQAFEKLGIAYRAAERSKSDLYLDVLPLVNAGRAEVLDLPRLATQLLGLERRTSRGGRDSIDHPPGALDDVANAVAGALVAAARGVPSGEWFFCVRPPTGIAALMQADPALGGLLSQESVRDGPL